MALHADENQHLYDRGDPDFRQDARVEILERYIKVYK